MAKVKVKVTLPTLYDTMLDAFKDAGYVVEEDSWMEGVGYDEPTREYWFDVRFDPKNIKDKSKAYVSHFFFGADKNKLQSHLLYETIYTARTHIIQSYRRIKTLNKIIKTT